MKKVLLTFADKSYRVSAQRLVRQAKEFNIFDEIFSWDESNIEPWFFKKFRSKLNIYTRGFGYWCWKPQILLQALECIDEGDMLLYVDVGCHLNVHGKKRLEEYFEILGSASKGILAFKAYPPEEPLIYDGRELLDQSNYKWIKGDLLDYFKVRKNQKVINSPATGAGILFIRKCPLAIQILNEWLQTFMYDFCLIDDSKSFSKNIDGFIEHRHDQAIFSILSEIHSIQSVSSYEYFYPKSPEGAIDWNELLQFPIHAKRDKKRKLGARIRAKLIREIVGLFHFIRVIKNK